jgi:dual specificity tyrosine-phosphorylation-regulated kinase 2/3/4
MSKPHFVQKYDEQMLSFEGKEVRDLKEQYIYYLGNSIKTRSKPFLSVTKNNHKAEQEVQKSLDDEEGYYNVVLGDHLMYRYEIIKILGKGSFA